MSENTAKAACTQREWEMARDAGIPCWTTTEEAAIHKFAEAIRQEAARQAMEREAVLREALQTIADWKLPATGKYWDESRTRPVSYAAEFGSNGERGYMRSVALIALDNTSGNGEGDGK